MLRLGVGARVMLRRNLDQQSGLINGATGEVVDIRSVQNNVVSTIVVRFAHLRKPVEIKRVRADWEMSAGVFIPMEQFPLTLAYAITIHKALTILFLWNGTGVNDALYIVRTL